MARAIPLEKGSVHGMNRFSSLVLVAGTALFVVACSGNVETDSEVDTSALNDSFAEATESASEEAAADLSESVLRTEVFDAPITTTSGGLSGTVPFGPIALPTFNLPQQTVGPFGRIDVTSSVTCSVSGSIAYSAARVGDRYVVSATPSATVTCVGAAHASRRGLIFRPTADGGVTFAVDVSATVTASAPATIDCSTPGSFKPTLSVKLSARISVQDVWS